MEQKKRAYLKEAWLVLALSFLFGGALATVQVTLSARIEENKRQDTLSQIPKLVRGAVRAQLQPIGDQHVYAAQDPSGATIGWVIPASGQGFADRLELLIGVDAAARKITGLYVLDQKETPGLGNKITEANWLAQFANRPTHRPLRVIKKTPESEEEIQGVTGATISSESVIAIVNKAVAEFRKRLSEVSVP